MSLYEKPYYGIDDCGNVVEHHGIKGMKWGVRRYQNEDGTLTEEGQKRYGNLSGDALKDAIKQDKKLFKSQKRISQYYGPSESSYDDKRATKRYERSIKKDNPELIEKRKEQLERSQKQKEAFYDIVKNRLVDLETLSPKEQKKYLRNLGADYLSMRESSILGLEVANARNMISATRGTIASVTGAAGAIGGALGAVTTGKLIDSIARRSNISKEVKSRLNKDQK